MIKILISVYIAAVLLVASFAEANTGVNFSNDLTSSNFQRVRNASTVFLNVMDAKFDSRKEILTLSGHVSSECLNSIQPVLNFDERTTSVLFSVTAKGQSCLNNTDSHYEIVVDVKSIFAQYNLSENSLVNFVIDNFVGAKGFSFKYLAKQQVHYSFDKEMSGTVELDHRTGKFYLVGRGSRIELLSRFDLNNFVDRFVQIKGLIPSAFAIGDGAIPMTSKLIAGQLTALR